MLLELTIVDARTPPASRDVLIDAPPGTCLADVLPQLRELMDRRDPDPTASTCGERTTPDPATGERTTVHADGRPVDPQTPLGQAPLLRGAVLLLDASGPRGTPASNAVVEVHVTGGPGAGRIVRLGRGRHLVGRDAGCAVRLTDPAVSRLHAELDVSAAGVTVRDLEPTNPSRLMAGPPSTTGSPLPPGARLLVGSTSLVLRRLAGSPAAATVTGGRLEVNRRPRYRCPPPATEVAFPDPPEPGPGHRLPLLAALTPVVLSGVLALVLRSPVMLLFALMSPALLLGQWLSDRRHGRVSHRRRLAEHVAATTAAQATLAAALAAETTLRHDEHPDLARVTVTAVGPQGEIWRRRPGDPDHLTVRLGTADQSARVSVTGAPPQRVHDVPAVISLADAGIVGVCGARDRVLSASAGLILQLATWQSPRDLLLLLLTTSARAEHDWRWLTRLPHCRPPDHDWTMAWVASSSDEVAVSRRVSELSSLLEARASPDTSASPSSAPDILVVLDGAHDLRQVPGLPTLLREGPSRRIRFLCLESTVERLPAETRTHVDVGPAGTPTGRLHAPEGRLDDIVLDLPDAAWVERMSRALAPLQDATPEPHESTLPPRVSFRGLLRDAAGIDPSDARSIRSAWERSSGVPSALLGVTREGPCAAHLVADGPHALVGGTTGSGKSELLQTLVAALAVTNRPDQVCFVLVDYKGGSAFRDCARLPHTLGLVTDLDEQLTARALTSLGAELKRRERLLAAAGAKDLTDYVARAPRDLPAIPRLVLVVDEFKVLADELPGFVDGLVRIAAVGRSLGIHLVLATQRPAGIISGDMRANVALRVALRVRDRADSDDVIESPEAAAISDRLPGRALVRTGDGRLVEVQTAHVGAIAVPDDEPPAAPRVWPLDWAALARPVARDDREGRSPDEDAARARRSELMSVVEAARAVAEQLGIEPPTSPWLPPLPERIAVDDLVDRSPVRAESTGLEAPDDRLLSVALGLADVPREQRQQVYSWDADAGHLAIAGGPRTGRTTALRTIALGIAGRHAPDEVHLHVLESAPGRLADLERLPHVGSVTSTADPVRLRRAVARLVERLSDATATVEEPRVVVLIDGWESVMDRLDDIEHGEPVDELNRLLRDGLAAGVHLVVTGGRAVVSGQLAGLVGQRVALAMPDPLDLLVAGVPPEAVPSRQLPGRGVEVHSGTEVQLAHVGSSPDPVDQTAATTVIATDAASRWTVAPRAALPWQLLELPSCIELGQVPSSSPGRLTIGVGGDDLGALGFDIAAGQRRILVAGPVRSGRSTALLALSHRLLASGRELAVLTTRRSPLSALSGIPRVHLLGPHDSATFVTLRRERPDLAIIVDDAEGLTGAPVEQAVLEAAHLVDDADGVLAEAVDVRRTAEHYRGLVPGLAAEGTGILLSPAPGDGEILRTRVDASGARQPGRGVHVTDGVVTPIQVALPPAVDEREISDTARPGRGRRVTMEAGTIPAQHRPARPVAT